ncbi:MAG: uroporphyrinogen-III C-methyltransferase [Gammaproteobacteria bacterium]|nr:uroporphyrinogen-III C-methyltransferase [Gammaproteobacteria bacterium]NIR99094.1 uroporphyrinogen-III C-methyltransferase [Gammaproteobacteria bacterium]NIT64726.1 uroporphyrinogen-III C-methyltransferase [Gammaproteobacteria bacterium]NIV21684.1 uroporphyrinogen-III C-methyltransferase [Gammaproteobacteria bacterium]NIX10555.1 uroporphyrinogen-III C-methyltransferase [Gammaproteobacteria bacterium]
MDFLPVFLNLKGRSCLVVGGGEVAARKVGLLREAGAEATVVAPRLCPVLQAMAERGELAHRQGGFEAGDLGGRAAVIAATDDGAVNERVSALARERGIPVNVVDNPRLCTFIVPSIIDRSPVQIAVSTGGASPVLARLLRSRLETLIPSRYGDVGALLEEYRGRAKQVFADVDARRRFWESVLQGPILEMVLSGQDAAARETLEKAFAQAQAGGAEHGVGEVYLVGGGPGDPDLLTFRALRLLQQADVVVHDRLVSKEVLAMMRRDAERVYVGKERDNHALPQEDINQLLVRLAKEGKRVCRLKGGDPFIFGRGGEEIDTLAEEGIPFQVVPAITAASGVAAYAGIPLTHRDYAHSVVFTTGHLKDGTMDLNWSVLVQPKQTVVFYMGLHGVDIICKELIAHGMLTTMPAALVQQGTTPNQRVFTATLDTLPGVVHSAAIKPPTLIIVGEVVKLHDKLKWFDPQHEEQEIFGGG